MSTRTTLLTDRSMKRDARKGSRLITMPGGAAFSTPSSAASSACVSASVLVPGDFCTLTTTAGRPRSDAVPRRGAAAIRTSATSAIVIGAPSSMRTSVRAMSSVLRTRAIWRIGSS